MHSLTMVGFGNKTTPSFADLNFANVKQLPIDDCIKQMYGQKAPSHNYDKNNVICIHGIKSHNTYQWTTELNIPNSETRLQFCYYLLQFS